MSNLKPHIISHADLELTVKAQAFLQLIFKPKSKPNPIPSYCWNYRNAPLCLSKNIVLFVYLFFFFCSTWNQTRVSYMQARMLLFLPSTICTEKPSGLWNIFYNLFYIYAIVCFSITCILYVIIR